MYILTVKEIFKITALHLKQYFTMDSHARSRRKALKVAVGALCKEVGFGMAEESSLETLTEMLQSCKCTDQ